MRFTHLAVSLGLLLWSLPLHAADEILVDCSQTAGVLRPLHGVNSGPLCAGDTLDLSAYHRQAGFPLVRLHDCHWPNADVVDIHVIFPDFLADPRLPQSYDFRRTDDYLRSILATGAKIVFRLGESIEHTKRKYHVHPPADPDKWADICLGIVRHYNDGWADGFRHDIRYWEIWNEPENRPAMWTGTDYEYFRMYSAAAKAIKSQFPGVYVGGPAVGYLGTMSGEELKPSEFVQAFLDHCRRDAAPLDFFSWHTYTSDPRELARRAAAVRRMLDERGFPRAQSHLNEWNFLPDNDWMPMLSPDGRVRQAWCRRIAGPEGAAFTAAALMLLEDTPLDAANYYSADNQGFGLFNEYGVPKTTYYALRAFQQLLSTPRRIVLPNPPDRPTIAAAGMNDARSRVQVLVANPDSREATLRLRFRNLPWAGSTSCQVQSVDKDHELTAESPVQVSADGPLEQTLPPCCVRLVDACAGKR